MHWVFAGRNPNICWGLLKNKLMKKSVFSCVYTLSSSLLLLLLRHLQGPCTAARFL